MSVLEALQNPDLLSGEAATTETTEKTEVTPEKPEGTETSPENPQETPNPEEKVEVVTPEQNKEKEKEETTADPVEKSPENPVEGEDTPKTVKQKIEYLEFLEQHKKEVATYLEEKSIDYSKLEPEEIVFKQYKLKYPSLKDEDIREELKIQYGIGEDIDLEDSEEVIRHRAKQRKLAMDATNAVKDLESYRDSLQLPEFELELPVNEVVKTENVDTEELLKKQIEQQREEDLKWRETTWTPKVTEVVSGITQLTQTVDVEGVGPVEVKVSLDDSDKKAISEYLSHWVYHPTDSKYLREDGEPDLVGFVTEMSNKILQEKLLSQAAKSAVEKYKEIHFKKEVINLNQDAKNTVVPDYSAEGELAIAGLLQK